MPLGDDSPAGSLEKSSLRQLFARSFVRGTRATAVPAMNLLSAGALSAKKGAGGLLRGLNTAIRGKGDAEAAAPAAPDATEGAFNAASRQYEPDLFSEIRDVWVQRHMQSRVSEYTERKPLCVCVNSWNVAAKRPPAGLAEWLQLQRGADVYAVGLQEVVELSAQNLAAGASGQLSAAAAAWEARIDQEISEACGDETYTKVACRQLMGLLLLVYVRTEHLPHCRPTRTAALGTGLLGAGNKGAVAVSLRLHSSSIAFVCAHLASGRGNAETRNLEAAQLHTARHVFPPADPNPNPKP